MCVLSRHFTVEPLSEEAIDWLKKMWFLFLPIIDKNKSQSWLACAAFSAFDADSIFCPLVFIGF